MLELVGNPEDLFSHNEAHIVLVYFCVLKYEFNTSLFGSVIIILRVCPKIGVGVYRTPKNFSIAI